jgi:RNA polymerase-binding protein DksA
MKRNELNALAAALRRRREALFQEVADAEAGLQFIAEDRESEIEELAQEERTAQLFNRLDLRGKREIEAIDAALARIEDGAYGTCTGCGGKITAARLRALPYAESCLDCARGREAPGPAPAAAEMEAETPRSGPVPPDLSDLTDREMETALREQVRADGRVDMEELRIVCRHGVVYLSGALPSEGEHQMLLKLVTDVAGFEEVVDRVQVEGILWERRARSKRTPGGEEAAVRVPPGSYTEDVVKSVEEGIEFVPPVEPPADE